MHSDQRESSVFVNRTIQRFKRDLNDDSDGEHLTSFGTKFLTEEKEKEKERSSSVDLLCAGLLRRGMVYGASVTSVRWLYMQHVSNI